MAQPRRCAGDPLEIMRGCDIIDWHATEGRRVYGRVIPSRGMRNIHLVL
jgi:succinate-semialdehyde dehydrogenase / glutarate-semialdehyde dehydrogenase